jgi:tetratricopeptide (TPR) repeat protein
MQAQYGDALRGLLEVLPNRFVDLERERQEAPELIDELAALVGEEAQIRRLDEDPRFHTWGLCDLLIEESRRAAFGDPEMAQLLARLAIALVDRLDAWRYGAAFLEDLRALGWAYYGNGLRVASELRRADDALERALGFLEAGSGDPLVAAQLFTLEASLRRAQRRFDEAQRLLDEVIFIYRETGEHHLEGRTLVKKAIGLRNVDAAQDALPFLLRAVELIEPERDPRLHLCAHHNLVYCLLDADRPAEARALLERIRPAYAEFDDFSTRLRLRWIEGKLAAVEERFELAEAAFREVRAGFLEQGIGYDAALVSLDLALLYLDRGQNAAVLELAQQMLPIFQAQDVHREAVAALLIFQRAAVSHSLTSGTVEGISAYLRRARHDPACRYEEPS